jgi:hypothetical protein
MKPPRLAVPHRLARRAAVAGALAAALVAGPSYPLPAGAQASAAPGGVHVFGWGFADVSAMAVSGGHLFVANQGAGTVTELDASTMGLVQVISGPAYGFDDPVAMDAAGGHVFVVNQGSGDDHGSVTELDGATGALVRVIDAPADRFEHPGALAADGDDLFVADAGPSFPSKGWVSELSMQTGALVRVLSGTAYRLQGPSGFAFYGGDVFVDNSGGWVSVLDASTGKFFRAFNADTPSGPCACMATSAGHLFVADQLGVVTELDASTGKLVRRLPGNFDGIGAIAVAGPDLFVADTQGATYGAVSELDTRTGAQVAFFVGAKHGFYGPGAFAVYGRHLFVGAQSSVAELDVPTRAFLGYTTGSKYDFEDPVAMAAAGPDLFVVNGGVNPDSSDVGITELVPSTGALVRVMEGPAYHFDNPVALAVSGHDLFVANAGGPGGSGSGSSPPDLGSVAEIDTSTGALVRVMASPWTDPHPSIDQPHALAVVGDVLFVAENDITDNASSVAEVDISTGSVVKMLSGPAYGFATPSGLAVAGADLFVANEGGGNKPVGFVTELDTATGDVVRTFPVGTFAVDGQDLFGLSADGNSIREFGITTGKLVRLISSPPYQSGSELAMAVDGNILYVVNNEGNSVTELDTSTGALVSVLSGPAYQFNLPTAIVVSGTDVFVANSGGVTTRSYDIGHTVTELPAA